MCLILFAWQTHPRYRLVVAANRDESFERPSAPAGLWSDCPQVLAGRDLEAGGTWLGITRAGRFAAISNYRAPAEKQSGAPSRGALVGDFLRGADAPLAYLKRIAPQAAAFNGFNLLAGDRDSLYFLSNRGAGVERVAPGVHGLSNHLLDTPWPKVERGKAALATLLERPFEGEDLLEMLADTTIMADGALPATGASLDWERRLSAMRIVAGTYGTRCSTALSVAADGDIRFAERSYAPDGSTTETVRFHLPPAGGAISPDGATSPDGESRPRQIRPLAR